MNTNSISKKDETKVSVKKRLVLLDAHAILHRAYHALPDFATASGQPTGALYGLSAMVLKIIEDLKPDYMAACYDVKGPTYRHEAYKEYKAGRKAAEDDLVVQMNRSRDIFTALNIPIYDKQGFEADDILGTIVEQLSGTDTEIIIASGDMDTLQLVSGDRVKAYTLKKGINDTIMYNEKAVRDRYGFGPELVPDYKGLRGDPSDNIVGVKGIGEKTATILLTTFGSIENIYKELESEPISKGEEKFKKAGITPRIIQLLRDNKEEAEFSKMLATIRRDVPIKFSFPENIIKDSIDSKKINALWTELEFRTLPQRFAQQLSKWRNPEAKNPDETSDKPAVNGQLGLEISPDPVELEKVSVALWLIQSNLTNPKLEDVLQYSNTDDFGKAREAIMSELKKRNLTNVYENIELPLIPITHRMEERGVRIDRKILSDLSKEYHTELDLLQKNIWQAAGVEFNINSPKQLGEILFDKLGLTAKNMKKTGGGARSTKESELEKLRDLHPIVPFIFEYRELAKLLSTYIDAIPPQLDGKDRLHTDFVPAGTTTGRMASINPNLQNIPIKSELGKAIRTAFIAEDGFVLAGFDYSQMELRIAAFMSGDQKLIEIFRKGDDVHTSVASEVFKVPREAVTSNMRRQAKVINFGIIYGMGVMALKQNLGTTREEAQKFMNEYFATFSTLATFLEKVREETSKRGFTETFFGRRRYFEGINSKIPFVRAQAERMAINAPIQGTGADVIKLAIIKIDEYIRNEKLENDVFPILQVHDELVFEIRQGKEQVVVPKIEEIMESIIDPKEIEGIVMKATAATGNNWGELK
ncbi:MAG: DNA polymerase [Candidatus Paceibacterota bacterium]|jgi:DNA polymerase-1